MVVDLPAPFAPNKPKISPGLTSKERFDKADFSLKLILAFFIFIIIVKSVSFSKSANSSLMPARLEREGEFNPLNQLAEVYNVTITMFGNTLFRPGQIIYINPFGLAPTGGIGQPHDPKSISNIGLDLYHCFSQVKDALSELDRYTQGYVDDYLFDGKEMIKEAKRIQSKMAKEKKNKDF